MSSAANRPTLDPHRRLPWATSYVHCLFRSGAKPGQGRIRRVDALDRAEDCSRARLERGDAINDRVYGAPPPSSRPIVERRQERRGGLPVA